MHSFKFNLSTTKPDVLLPPYALDIPDPEVRAKLLAAAERRRAELIRTSDWFGSDDFQLHLINLVEPEFQRLYKDVEFSSSDEQTLVAKLVEVGREIEAGRIPANAMMM